MTRIDGFRYRKVADSPLPAGREGMCPGGPSAFAYKLNTVPESNKKEVTVSLV